MVLLSRTETVATRSQRLETHASMYPHCTCIRNGEVCVNNVDHILEVYCVFVCVWRGGSLIPPVLRREPGTEAGGGGGARKYIGWYTYRSDFQGETVM